jgi:hypothetical protein
MEEFKHQLLKFTYLSAVAAIVGSLMCLVIGASR